MTRVAWAAGSLKAEDFQNVAVLEGCFLRHTIAPKNIQARKKSTKINFLGPETDRWGGVFHAKGWWPRSSCSPSKVCLPWVWKREIWDVPGISPGCPGPLGVLENPTY